VKEIPELNLNLCASLKSVVIDGKGCEVTNLSRKILTIQRNIPEAKIHLIISIEHLNTLLTLVNNFSCIQNIEVQLQPYFRNATWPVITYHDELLMLKIINRIK